MSHGILADLESPVTYVEDALPEEEAIAKARRRLRRHIALGIGLIYQGTASPSAVEQMLPLALKVSDYAYIISRGEIVYESSAEALEANEEAKRRFLGVAN